MKYKAQQQTKLLFINNHEKVPTTLHAYLFAAIDELTKSLSTLLKEQSKYLKKTGLVFRLLILKNRKWNYQDFIKNVVDKLHKQIELDNNSDVNQIRSKVAEALSTIRNLFDGSITTYEKIDLFREQPIEQSQIKEVRKTMQSIIYEHITILIDCIDKEVAKQGDIIQTIGMAKGSDHDANTDDQLSPLLPAHAPC